MTRTKRLTFLWVVAIVMFGGCLSSLSWAAQKCDDWAVRIVSVQGEVQSRKEGETAWSQVELDDTLCPGDMIRVGPLSRAGVLLRNDTVLRLDENRAVTFPGEDRQENFLLRLLSGAAHFFSRTPRGFKVITPFVNATIGGTEFLVRVDAGGTQVTVFEGAVSVENEVGSLSLAKGESALTSSGKAPEKTIVLRPRDSVQWAIYAPAVIDYRLEDFDAMVPWQAKVRRSLAAYLENDLTGAFAALEGETGDVSDPRFFT
ncbi:MAG: FecR domain-containing protein, partial [Syntrophobacteraceae bacterium]|nr:FecR domain-containing protein [Syntrophobacteraceae bacterium]